MESKCIQRFVRNSKKDGHTVLSAIEVETYTNGAKVACYMNVPEILKVMPSDELALEFMRGYILARGHTLSQDAIIRDLKEAMSRESGNLRDMYERAMCVMEEHIATVDKVRDLNRIKMNKPKVIE